MPDVQPFDVEKFRHTIFASEVLKTFQLHFGTYAISANHLRLFEDKNKKFVSVLTERRGERLMGR